MDEKKKEIVINNYFNIDCDFNTSIKEAYIKGFNRGIEKAETVYCKKLKALEIIKEKGIILQFIKETYTVEQYNAGVFGTLVKPLTKEEYDLLKEIFL